MNKLFTICCLFVLLGCDGANASNKDMLKSICISTPSECDCFAHNVTASITDPELDALLSEVRYYKSLKGGDNMLVRKLELGRLVNPKVSAIVIDSFFVCQGN